MRLEFLRLASVGVHGLQKSRVPSTARAGTCLGAAPVFSITTTLTTLSLIKIHVGLNGFSHLDLNASFGTRLKDTGL